jgi:GT2 family glycosyltransferase
VVAREAGFVRRPTSSKDVAAVILAHNPGPGFDRVLDAVRSQVEPPRLVVVVDNASTDGTAERLRDEVGVEVVALDTNLGVGAGHNRGWAVARERFPDLRAIWSLEHDCVPEPDCLKLLIAAVHEQLDDGVQLAAVVPMQTGPGQPWRRPPGTPFAVRNLTFNGALVLVDAMDAVDGLREDFFVGQEDKEFSVRLRQLGFEVIKDRRARLEHANWLRPKRPSVLRGYYSRRNEAYLAVHIRRDRFAKAWVVYRAAGGVARALVGRDQRWTRARARARAALDGIRGDLGYKTYPYLRPDP